MTPSKLRLGASVLALAALTSHANAANAPILPVDDGPTFARAIVEDETRLLMALSDHEETVRAVDLTRRFGADAQSPMALLVSRDTETVRNAVTADYEAGDIVSLPRADLITPIEPNDQSVAIALNYPSHSAEAGVAPR